MRFNFLKTNAWTLMIFSSLLHYSCGSKSDSATGPTVTLKGSGTTGTTLSLSSGTIDAATMKFTIYKFAVSTSTNCAHPITVFSSTAGVQRDMLSNPTFGTGSLASGTYPCVIIEMSKVIKDSAATSSGACVAGTEITDLICHDGQTAQLIDGTSVTCSGGTGNDQHVAAYITTLSAGTSGDRSFLPPSSTTDTSSGVKLTSPFVLSGDASGTFSVTYRNFFSADLTSCGSNAPTFSFH